MHKEEFVKLYKYMRIYLWSALRTMVLRMSVLRKRDLITDLRCLLTRQVDVGQALQTEWRVNFGLAVRPLQPKRLLWRSRQGKETRCRAGPSISLRADEPNCPASPGR